MLLYIYFLCPEVLGVYGIAHDSTFLDIFSIFQLDHHKILCEKSRHRVPFSGPQTDQEGEAYAWLQRSAQRGGGTDFQSVVPASTPLEGDSMR